jgi:hypothetical protein
MYPARMGGICPLLLALLATPSPKSITLVLVSSGKGDRALAQAVDKAMREVMTVDDRGQGDFTGRLRVTHWETGALLDLTVVTRGGSPVGQAAQNVPPNEDPLIAARSIAAQIAAACNAIPVEAPRTRAAQAREKRGDDWAGTSEPFLATPPKHLELFVAAELGFGPWSADPNDIISGSAIAFDFQGYAQAFARHIDRHWRPAFDLHGGCRFLDYASAELAFNSSAFSGGDAILAGLALGFHPLEAFAPQRNFDVGITLGFGRAFVAGGDYDMSGWYWSLGLTGEVPLNSWAGLTFGYQLFRPGLNKFYVDYSSGFSQPVDGFTATWNVFAVGLDLHKTLSWN